MDNLSTIYKYPNKNAFKAFSFSPSEQTVFNEFPRYSITFYDDQNFTYRRQSINGKPVLSKIISDDFYPFNLSYTDRTNYISGQSNVLKVFYAKILVYKAITQDTVNATSTVFYLTRTQTLGTSKTVYYSVKCVEKNDQYTVYSSRISLNNSDFVNQYDGEAFFTLVGDFSVSLNYPISLTINNSATSSISETTTSAVYNTISTSVNNLNFYENVPVNFDYYQYSDSFDFNFSPLALTLSDTLFSTTSTIYTTNTSSGTSIRFNFIEGYSVASLYNFALTIANDSAGFNPAVDTLFTLTFRLSNGEFVSLNACEIFNNFVSGYFNIVFNFEGISWPDNFINYFILEIKTITTLTQPYEITYLNFVSEVNNVNTFSLKTLSVKNQSEQYVFNPNNQKLLLSNLENQMIIQSSDIYSTVDTLLSVKDEANYLISTQSGEIELPENALIKTESIFIPVFNLEKNTKVKFHENYETIKMIKVLPSSFIDLVDVYENTDYVLNGFNIKNPFFSKNYERKILNKKQYNSELKSLSINNNIFQLLSDKKYAFIQKEINFLSEISNKIEIEDASAVSISMLFSCSEPVYLLYGDDVKIISDKEIIKINIKNDLSPLILKSKSSFSIKKLLILYEF